MDALKGQPIFTLDDEQAYSFSTIIFETNSALEHNKRRTIIIKGGTRKWKINCCDKCHGTINSSTRWK